MFARITKSAAKPVSILPIVSGVSSGISGSGIMENIVHRRMFSQTSQVESSKSKTDQLPFLDMGACDDEMYNIRYNEPEPYLLRNSGSTMINDPLLNKGTGFPLAERDRVGIRGLVPPVYFDIDQQADRMLNAFRSLESDLDRFMFLRSLQDRNEVLFYRVLMENIEEMAPIVYTPTVGVVCQKFGELFRRTRGMYFSSYDKGEMTSMVYNWPKKHVDIIVVTDGSRILGLGDLGVNGMGIPIGKLSLYVAAAGIHPARVLPVMLDVGTNNEQLLNDPRYFGVPHKRLSGNEYYEIVDELMVALNGRFPNAMIQFEDFNNEHARPLLDKYRHDYLTFNDDIQGTGTVALAGILCSLKMRGMPSNAITQQKIVCLGAGSAGLGVSDSIHAGMTEEGMSAEQAYKNFYLLDVDGLLTNQRDNISDAQKPYARDDLKDGMNLLDVVKKVKPDVLLGLSGVGGAFQEEVIREMAKHKERPVIFPMSNPTKNAECTAEQAYTWTEGRAIMASGSPFDPVEVNGRVHHTAQGNNMFIFPGLGLGAISTRASKVSDTMLYAATSAVVSEVTDEELAKGFVYPDVSRIREVSRSVALAVAQAVLDEGLSQITHLPHYEELPDIVTANTYYPGYSPYVVDHHRRGMK